MCHAPFQSQRSKIKVKRVIGSFRRARSVALCLFNFNLKPIYCPTKYRIQHHGCDYMTQIATGKISMNIHTYTIWPIHFICGTNTTHGAMTCRAPLPGQKIKGQGLGFICAINVTHEVAMCRAPFSGQSQGLTGRSKFCHVRFLAPWYMVVWFPLRTTTNFPLWFQHEKMANTLEKTLSRALMREDHFVLIQIWKAIAWPNHDILITEPQRIKSIVNNWKYFLNSAINSDLIFIINTMTLIMVDYVTVTL